MELQEYETQFIYLALVKRNSFDLAFWKAPAGVWTWKVFLLILKHWHPALEMVLDSVFHKLAQIRSNYSAVFDTVGKVAFLVILSIIKTQAKKFKTFQSNSTELYVKALKMTCYYSSKYNISIWKILNLETYIE